jgi:hypothetical protein
MEGITQKAVLRFEKAVLDAGLVLVTREALHVTRLNPFYLLTL